MKILKGKYSYSTDIKRTTKGESKIKKFKKKIHFSWPVHFDHNTSKTTLQRSLNKAYIQDKYTVSMVRKKRLRSYFVKLFCLKIHRFSIMFQKLFYHLK